MSLEKVEDESLTVYKGVFRLIARKQATPYDTAGVQRSDPGYYISAQCVTIMSNKFVSPNFSGTLPSRPQKKCQRAQVPRGIVFIVAILWDGLDGNR